MKPPQSVHFGTKRIRFDQRGCFNEEVHFKVCMTSVTNRKASLGSVADLHRLGLGLLHCIEGIYLRTYMYTGQHSGRNQAKCVHTCTEYRSTYVCPLTLLRCTTYTRTSCCAVGKTSEQALVISLTTSESVGKDKN